MINDVSHIARFILVNIGHAIIGIFASFARI